jgi:hypothetical protein
MLEKAEGGFLSPVLIQTALVQTAFYSDQQIRCLLLSKRKTPVETEKSSSAN